MNARTVAVGLALGVTLWVLPALAEKQQEHPNLSGTWELDEARSENPREKMREAIAARRGPGGFGGRGSGGPHGGGRGPGGAPGGGAGDWVGGSRPDPEGMGNRPSVLEPEFGRLTIEHAEPLVVFLGDDGVRRELETGSRTEEETAAGVQTTKAKWKEDRLVVVRRGERGKLTETWELDESGDELFVTVEIEGSGSMPSVSVLRTYLRAESADEPSAASDVG